MQNEAKNEAKIDLNEAKIEAKRSKKSEICAKRSEDPQAEEEGLNEPQGGYMSRDRGLGEPRGVAQTLTSMSAAMLREFNERTRNVYENKGPRPGALDQSWKIYEKTCT